MPTFTIPTIYTAIDKFTGPVRRMQSAAAAFGEKTEASLSRLDRKMRPIGKNAAMIGTAIIAPLALAANEARKFEDALSSFRTIVSDLSDKDFAKYETAVKQVGAETKSTYSDVASSFEKIAGLNAKFAETSEGIANVTKAAIILSRASRVELGQSAENLVGIMNQFSLGADQATRAINVLAAGQAAGAATIAQTAESFVNFGSVAAGANITLEQSVALVQTLGKFSLFGAEAGTKLRGAILRLQRAGVGYTSGQFKVNDALDQSAKKLATLRTEKQKDAYLNQLFGAENIAAGRILLSNIGLYKEFTKAVTGTSEAEKAAAINQNTFTERLKQAKSQALNLAVNIGEKLLPHMNALADKLIPIVERMLNWTQRNPETIKTVLKVALAAAALSYAIAGVSGAVAAATKVMQFFNFVMGLNPVFLLITGVGLLAFGIYKLTSSLANYTTAQKMADAVQNRALENTIDQRVEITTLFAALRKATVGTDEYKSILSKIEAIQPGITKQYELQAGAIDKINQAEKALTKSIMERATAEARAQILREKTRELLIAQQTGPSTMDYVKSFFSNIYSPGMAGLGAEQNKLARVATLQDEINTLANQQAADMRMPTSTKETQSANMQSLIQTNNARLDINMNDPGGAVKSFETSGNFVSVKTTPSKQVP